MYRGEAVDVAMEAMGEADEVEGWPVGQLLEASEAVLARAERMTDCREALKLTFEALRIRRMCCHPLSMQRYHAEEAARDLATQAGETEIARECGGHALAFLQMALSHVSWHPGLSLERFQQAQREVAAGDAVAALEHLSRCEAALSITHGSGHALTRRVLDFRKQVVSDPL